MYKYTKRRAILSRCNYIDFRVGVINTFSTLRRNKFYAFRPWRIRRLHLTMQLTLGEEHQAHNSMKL